MRRTQSLPTTRTSTPNTRQNSHVQQSTLNGKRITATLDLHRKTKEQAIASLTQFLSNVVTTASSTKKRRNHERSQSGGVDSARPQKSDDEGIWVLVITGTGKHSGHSGGPVIRTAVERLCIKRCMTHHLVNGRGAFLIRADSGFALYNEEYKDTKVIVAPESSSNDQVKLILQNTAPRIASSVDDNPLPREAHEESEAIRLSLTEHAQHLANKQIQAVQQDLETAIIMSLTTTAKREQQTEDVDSYKKAIEESLQLQLEQQHADEKSICEALALSKLQQQDDEFRRQCGENDQDDDEMQHVLELSKHQVVTEEELLRMALEESLKEQLCSIPFT